MSKFLRNMTDGSLRCKYCGDRVCDCMEDGITTVRVISVLNNTKSLFVKLAKQTLPNGKEIPSRAEIYFPKYAISKYDKLSKTMDVDNDFLNRLRFD